MEVLSWWPTHHRPPEFASSREERPLDMDRLEHLPDIEAEESVDDLLEGLCMMEIRVSDEDEVAELHISDRGGE